MKITIEINPQQLKYMQDMVKHFDSDEQNDLDGLTDDQNEFVPIARDVIEQATIKSSDAIERQEKLIRKFEQLKAIANEVKEKGLLHEDNITENYDKYMKAAHEFYRFISDELGLPPYEIMRGYMLWYLDEVSTDSNGLKTMSELEDNVNKAFSFIANNHLAPHGRQEGNEDYE